MHSPSLRYPRCGPPRPGAGAQRAVGVLTAPGPLVASCQRSASALPAERLRIAAMAPAMTAANASFLSTRATSSQHVVPRDAADVRLGTGGAGTRVGLGGLEPPASSLSGMRSNRLSYRPVNLEQLTWTDRAARGPPQARSERVSSRPPTRSEQRL